jgi:hypothetical protein
VGDILEFDRLFPVHVATVYSSLDLDFAFLTVPPPALGTDCLVSARKSTTMNHSREIVQDSPLKCPVHH